MAKTKQASKSTKSDKKKAEYRSESGGIRKRPIWPVRLIWALLLAILIVAVVAVCVYHFSKRDNDGVAGWRSTHLNLTDDDYATCSDDSASNGTGGRTDEARCLTDDDIAIISKATYTPMSHDEAADRLIDTQDGHGRIVVDNMKDLKRYLDYAISTDVSVMHYGTESSQLASTIKDDGNKYVYAFYLNTPASAACYTKCPDDMNCFVQPSYDVEIGAGCNILKGGDYRESRGFTIVGQLEIDKDDMEVAVNKAGDEIDIYDNYVITLTHDSDHNLDYVDYDEIYKKLTESK